MRIKHYFKAVIITALSTILLSACQSVRPYQRIFLNDHEMQMGATSGQQFEQYVEGIREGATPPASGKASGGCGCN
ncbi:MAG: hypothetical protein DHS20C18_39330 [Saprospiraceae bacterium]|nr:MAG: hypothetical protein DHS20C18_39330 [Saprospiraceae bacterium]